MWRTSRERHRWARGHEQREQHGPAPGQLKAAAAAGEAELGIPLEQHGAQAQHEHRQQQRQRHQGLQEKCGELGVPREDLAAIGREQRSEPQPDQARRPA